MNDQHNNPFGIKPKRKKQPKQEEPKVYLLDIDKLNEEKRRNDERNNLEAEKQKKEYEAKIDELKTNHQKALAIRKEKLKEKSGEFDDYKNNICKECKKKVLDKQKPLNSSNRLFVWNNLNFLRN